MFEPAEDYDQPPPPAYEVSQEDFDQKTSHVVQASLAAESTARRSDEDDEWEVWDEAAFQAAAAGDGASSSSSLPAAPPPRPEKAPIIDELVIQPLKIVKNSNKNPSPHLYSKADDANGYRPLPGVSPHPISQSISPTENPYTHSRSLSTMSSRRTPPPSFETESPSLDGPPYEEVILQYQPGDSRAASPLLDYPLTPRPSRPPQAQLYGAAPRNNSHSPSSYQRQQRPSVPQRVSQRQLSQYPPPTTRLVSLSTNFNPLSAYSKPLLHPTASEAMPTKVDAAALYASAVSAHLPSKAPQRPRQNHMYQQDSPTIPQSQIYNSPYNGGYYPGDQRSRFSSTSSDSNRSMPSQPCYSQQPLSPNHADTRWHNSMSYKPYSRPNY